jgi:hypothetical protein
MLHELSALARRCCGLVNPLTNTLLVACGVRRCGDDSDIVNNIPYFLLDPLRRNHDAQDHLDIRKPILTFLSCFDLGELSSAVGTKGFSEPMIGPLFRDRSRIFIFRHQ